MSDRDGTNGYKWIVVAMLWTIVFFNYADRQALSAVVPLIRGELHLSPHEEGIIGAAFAWVYGLCSPFAGRLVDRIRRRTAILGGLQIWSVICAATALAPGFGWLVAFRAAEGLGETTYFPGSVSLISDYHDRRTRSRALGLHQTGVYVGVVGGTTVAALIGQHYGWRAPFVVFGLCGMLLSVVLYFVLREPPRPAAASTAREASFFDVIAEVTTTPAAPFLLAAFVCANAVASVLLFWLPTYVHDSFHLTLAVSGLSASFFAQAGSFAGAITGGWSADRAAMRSRNGRILVQAFGLGIGIPFVVLSGMTRSLTVVLIAFFGWGFFKGMYEANIFASMFDVTRPEIRGSVVGLMNMAGWLFGAGTAPVLIGYIAEVSSLGTAIASAALIYVAAVVLLLIAAARNRGAVGTGVGGWRLAGRGLLQRLQFLHAELRFSAP